jgi:hypothetical protein
MGDIFLVEDKSDVLIMKSYYMFPEEFHPAYAEVPIGTCFYEQAALNKRYNLSPFPINNVNLYLDAHQHSSPRKSNYEKANLEQENSK